MEDTLEYYLITDFNEEVLNGIDRAEDIPMSNVIAHYEGTYFVNDDFYCSMDED